jgi:hypothetical protein
MTTKVELLKEALSQLEKMDFTLSPNWNGSIKTNVALLLEGAIAAESELLDALQKALRYIAAYRVESPADDIEPGSLIWPGEAKALYKEARKAIAKAEGRE